MKITITGDCPSKKNSVSLFQHPYTGRWMKAPGKVYQRWHRQAKKQLKGMGKIQVVKNITLIIYPKTRRKGDLTNKSESVMDLLVDCGVIEDDNWFVVPDVHPIFGGVDKLNPRVEVEIL